MVNSDETTNLLFGASMRRAYYLLCPLPAVCQLISSLSPNNWAAGGQSLKIQLVLLSLIALSSFVLTSVGLMLVSQTMEGKSKLGLLTATIIAALPGIYLLISNSQTHG